MSIPFPKAQKRKLYQADIVFCIDVTGSMSPCIEGLKKHIKEFTDAMQQDGCVGYRLALIGYRDRADQGIDPESLWGIPACDEPWYFSPGFTDNVQEFQSWLSQDACEAYGGGNSDIDPRESTLDAIYEAINHFKWRDEKTHRVVVVCTDADTHPELSPKTFHHRHNGVDRVLQEIGSGLKHGILFLCAPRTGTYDQISCGCTDASRQVIQIPVESGNSLKEVDFSELLQRIASTVSESAPSTKYYRPE